MATPAFMSDRLEPWRSLLAQDRERASELYFEEVLPGLLEYLTRLDVHRQIPDSRCETLISLMGLSPETTVIATAVLRPRRVLTIRSRGATSSFDRAAKFMIERGMVTYSGLVHDEVNGADPLDIYDTICRHIRGHETDAAVVDVTGGKKVMSASAALAASELGIPLCYIDGHYDPQLQRPIPGTERLIFLPNPSTHKAELARQEALAVYENRDYVSALRAFENSRDLQPKTGQFEDFALAVCRTYIAWADLDLDALKTHLDEARVVLQKPSVAHFFGGRFDPVAHFSALDMVARGEDLALIATLLELSNLYRERGRHDFSCLLAYRALESFVQHGLRALAGGQFDPSKPDYSRLGEENELEGRFASLAKQLHHEGVVELPRKLGLVDGFMLLCLIDALHERVDPRHEMSKVVQHLKGVAQLRNSSVLAHGHKNLSARDSTRLLVETDRLGRAVLREEFGRLEQLTGDLKPIALSALVPR